MTKDRYLDLLIEYGYIDDDDFYNWPLLANLVFVVFFGLIGYWVLKNFIGFIVGFGLGLILWRSVNKKIWWLRKEYYIPFLYSYQFTQFGNIDIDLLGKFVRGLYMKVEQVSAQEVKSIIELGNNGPSIPYNYVKNIANKYEAKYAL